jgi:hypothetical protein
MMFPSDKPEDTLSGDILSTTVAAHEKNLDAAIKSIRHSVQHRSRMVLTYPQAQALLDFIEAQGELVDPDPSDPSGDVPHFE